MKTIVFSGGGTLGHITPALSFIKILKKKYPHFRIIYFATNKDRNYEVLTNNLDIDKIYYFNAYGASKKISQNIKRYYLNKKASLEIKKVLEQEKPSLVVGMGGFISALTIKAASKQNIKSVIHEQNSVMGFANKLVLKDVEYILTSFKDTKISNKYIFKVKWIGSPRFDLRYEYNILPHYNKNKILIMSGSLGSDIVNQMGVSLINSEEGSKYDITLVTGRRYYDKVKEAVTINSSAKIIPFSNHIIEEINKASIVVSRAGSSSIFELLGLNKPAILIPSPNVTNNHQYYNAYILTKDNIFLMLEEKELSKELLLKKIEEIINNYEYYFDKINSYEINNVSNSFIRIIISIIEKED